MHPVFGGEIVEREQLVEVVGDLRDGLDDLAPKASLNAATARRAWSRSSAFQISARAFFAPGWADFGSADNTLPILWNQQRCSRVVGNTSRNAVQNPSAPSPAARTGARIPRRAQSRSRSAHDPVDSR
jgi:hypothetical protein